MTPEALDAHLKTCATAHVSLIGDIIEDVNTYCRVRGVSAETPTMVLEELHTEKTLGGAACVMRNLETLGAKVMFHHPLARVRKTRFWVDAHKLLQVDTFLNPPSALPLDVVRTIVERDNPVIVADYRHGAITAQFAGLLASKVRANFFVASQVSQEASNHHWYESPRTTFICNERENAAAVLQSAHNIVITRGALGSYPHIGERVPAIPITPVDTSGAGDAFLAAYALTESPEFANLWAGLSCTVKGANPPTIEQAHAWVREHP